MPDTSAIIPEVPSFMDRVSELRKEVLGQLIFLASARKFIFFDPAIYEDEEQMLQALSTFPFMSAPIGAFGAIVTMPIYMVYLSGDKLMLQGIDLETSEKSSIETDTIDTDTLAHILDKIHRGEFLESAG